MTISTPQNINGWMTHLSEENKFNISVDCAIFRYELNELQVLLMECDFPLYKGKWSLVGDLLKQNETINDAANRILCENTSLKDVYLEQVESFSGISRHPLGRVITMAYYSLIKSKHHQISHPTHLKLEWVNVKAIDELAFDHQQILDACYATLKKQVRLSSIAFNILPEKFSFMQLQRLYETILDVKIDKRNFRRRMNKLGYLIDVGEVQDDVSHRPAKLYSFDNKKYQVASVGGRINFMI